MSPLFHRAVVDRLRVWASEFGAARGELDHPTLRYQCYSLCLHPEDASDHSSSRHSKSGQASGATVTVSSRVLLASSDRQYAAIARIGREMCCRVKAT